MKWARAKSGFSCGRVFRMQPYDFSVVHISGKDDISDPLSRLLGRFSDLKGSYQD